MATLSIRNYPGAASSSGQKVMNSRAFRGDRGA